MYVSDCGRKLEYLKRRVENVQTPLQEAVTYIYLQNHLYRHPCFPPFTPSAVL